MKRQTSMMTGAQDGRGDSQLRGQKRRAAPRRRRTRDVQEQLARRVLHVEGRRRRTGGRSDRRRRRRRRALRSHQVRRELFASPTLLGLVRRVLSTSCWGSGEKGDGSGRAPRAWEVLASPEKFERAGAWNTSPNVPSAQSFPADALSRSMRAPEDFGIHFYSEFPIISDFRRSSRAARRAWRRRSTLRAC